MNGRKQVTYRDQARSGKVTLPLEAITSALLRPLQQATDRHHDGWRRQR
jgi:hypothetical protein